MFPFTAVPTLALPLVPEQVAIAESGTPDMEGVDAGVVLVAPVQKLESTLDGEMLPVLLEIWIKKIARTAVSEPEGDCHPCTAVVNVSLPVALLSSSLSMSFANPLSSLEDKVGQPDSGFEMICLSRAGLPAA